MEQSYLGLESKQFCKGKKMKTDETTAMQLTTRLDDAIRTLEPLFCDQNLVDSWHPDWAFAGVKPDGWDAAVDRLRRWRDIVRNGGFDRGLRTDRQLASIARRELAEAIEYWPEPLDNFGRNFVLPWEVVDEIEDLAGYIKLIYLAQKQNK